ncbi:MAG TPA: hypothetical protein DEB12_10035, partial [Porphyromonadaceae bacterium]|nr:hypothetical protein [Porphyromonadaceae bacterium]
NNSDLYFELSLTDGSTNKNVTLYPRSTQLITANEEAASLTGEVVSTYVRSDQHLKVNFPLN